MIKEELKNQLESVLDELGFPKVGFLVEYPDEEAHGDLAANVAMVLAKEIKK